MSVITRWRSAREILRRVQAPRSRAFRRRRESADRPLEQDDRPSDQIAALERQTDRLPTLGAELVEAILAYAGVLLLDLAGRLQRDDDVLPFLHPPRLVVPSGVVDRPGAYRGGPVGSPLQP